MNNRTNTKRYDTVIIGAGIAGLVCARALIEAGKSVLILEARDRLGGRILTARDAGFSFPIELGAEFIHGAPKVTFERLEAAGLTFYDLTDKHLRRPDAKASQAKTQTKTPKLVPLDYFEKIQNLFAKLDENRKTDRTVEQFLSAQKSLDPTIEKMARSYVEGFHAADPNLIGERALAQAQKSGDDLNGSESFRVLEGYDRLIAYLAQGTAARLNTIVKKISWKKSDVSIECLSAGEFELPAIKAKTVVVTIPLGVLKGPSKSKAAVEFDPVPKGYETALQGLEMGHAMRINFRFRSRFWDIGREEPIGFLHAGPEKDFPTWWSMMPLRTPILTAWQGGPKVEALSQLSDAERVQTALTTLAYILDMKLEDVQAQLDTWYFHDWSKDPYSLGAYSFVGVNGDERAKRLAEPFENTLFFAGEATHTSAERGTVDGAIDTGERAAKQVLKALS